MSESTPWYHEGLRFQCTQCGHCCSGNPGFVWLTEDEIRSIADYRKTSIGEMRINHIRFVGNRISLREYANGDCTFLDPQTRRCSVYPVRPAQCRTWPFWNSNLESPEAWADASAGCPGMGKGELVQLDVIQRQAAVVDV